MTSKLLPRLHHILASSLFLLAVTAIAQSTINVGPGKTYTTIQSGIDAAVNGDTVLVAPGTYYEHISFNNKLITVTSSGGASVTVIDGEGIGGLPTVLFTGAETRASILSGFTIRGGGDEIFSSFGSGGIYVSGTMSNAPGPSPIIQNNIITANYCHAIGVQDGTPAILNNEISGTLQNTTGTGAQESYCGPTDAIYLGGTPNFANATPVVAGNTIENNSAGGSAIHVNSANKVLVMNNVIRNNYSRSTGSAFMNENTSNSVVVQNLIYGNTSTCGGAISFNGAILVANNTLVDNLYVNLFSGSECTPIAQIYPDNYEYGESYPDRVIINNIISGNTSYPAVDCNQLTYAPPSLSTQPTFQNNVLLNTGGPFFGSLCVDVSHTDNNVVASPQFVNPSAGDYHLQSGSPAIDHGSNTVLQTFLSMTGKAFSMDFDGKPRVQGSGSQGCTIDIGAYEYPNSASPCATTMTLTSSLNPSNYGQSVTFSAQLSSAASTPTGDVLFMDGSITLGTETISASGSSTFTTSTLSVGTHNITATYQPTGVFTAASASLSQVVSGYATTTQLTCSPASITIFGTALFSATVTSGYGMPTGSITFTDNGTTLATQSLVSGSTNLTYTGQTVGTHTIVATYVPTGSFAGSSATCSETVTALPSTSVLIVAPTTSTYGTPVTLTANVSAATPPGPSTPTGTVTFYDGASIVGTGILTNGHASLTLSNLPGGNSNLTCTYSGSSIYATSNCNSVPITINAAASTLTLTSSKNPAFSLTPITFTATLTANGQPAPVGSIIMLTLNGQTSTLTTDAMGSATYTISTLLPGSYPVTANFAATSSLLASSASLTEIVTTNTTTTNLTVAPNPAYFTQLVTMTATVSSQVSSAQVTNGSVTFFDGTTALGMQTVTAAGVATFTTSTLAIGTHPITATYNPANTAFLPSSSAAVNEVILPSGFTIALSPDTISLPSGTSGKVTIQLTSFGIFSGPLALTYGALPTYATASINPTSVTLTAGGTGTSTLTLNTLFKADNINPVRPGSQRIPIIIAICGLLFLPMSSRRRRKISYFLSFALLMVAFQSITGCTNSWYIAHSVASGTYQVPVTATDVNHNAHTATLTVVVPR